MSHFTEEIMETELEKERDRKKIETIPLYGTPPTEWGFPPDHVKQAAKDEIDNPRLHPLEGMLELREAIGKRLESVNKVEMDPRTEIMTVPATMYALNCAMTLLLNPGDQALFYTPSYLFSANVERVGGIPVYVPTKEQDGFEYDAQALERNVDRRRTKLIVICNPNNPTGYVPTRQDLEEVAEIATKYDLFVLEDAIYDQLIYDGINYAGSIAQFPNMKERTLIAWSASKSMAMSHFRIGFLAGPEAIIKSALKLRRYSIIYLPSVSERALLAALTGPQGWLTEVLKRWQESRDMFCYGLAKINHIACVKPKATSFIYPNISATGLDDLGMYRYLYVNGLEVRPGIACSDFQHTNVRINLGGTRENIQRWLERFKGLIEILE